MRFELQIAAILLGLTLSLTFAKSSTSESTVEFKEPLDVLIVPKIGRASLTLYLTPDEDLQTKNIEYWLKLPVRGSFSGDFRLESTGISTNKLIAKRLNRLILSIDSGCQDDHANIKCDTLSSYLNLPSQWGSTSGFLVVRVSSSSTKKDFSIPVTVTSMFLLDRLPRYPLMYKLPLFDWSFGIWIIPTCGLILGTIITLVITWSVLTQRTKEVDWSPTTSWVSTLSLGGTVTSTITALGILKSTDNTTILILVGMFTLFILLAPFVYRLTIFVDKKITYSTGLMFVLASLITLFGSLGLMTTGFLILELIKLPPYYLDAGVANFFQVCILIAGIFLILRNGQSAKSVIAQNSIK